ncbi:HNH endonuclease signature motif containing protein [Bacillus sp. FSL M8-0168]|uniref:HNH endonuclease signature motif containing protein n=1 Tax=Bacillus sp. FSL M8-0168 TaxID=2921614 RepID=UPI0030FD9452
MKKFLQGLLISLLAVAVLFGFDFKGVQAASSEAENEATETLLKGTLRFEVDENKTAKLKEADFGDEKEQIKRADQKAAKLKHDYLIHSNPGAVSEDGKRVDLYSEKQKNNNKIKGKVPGYVEIQVETLLNPKNHTITNVIRIGKVMGEKPLYINASHDLLASRYYNGKFIKVLNHTKKFSVLEIKPGTSSSKSFKVGASSYYKRDYAATVVWKDSPPIADASKSSPFLANKKPALYPHAKDSHTKQVMGAPADANMKVVPKDKREDRDPNLRKKFKKWYIKKYGEPKWNWDNYEVHHVIPLKYGGSNDMSNFFPLEKKFHQKTVTPWWSAY